MSFAARSVIGKLAICCALLCPSIAFADDCSAAKSMVAEMRRDLPRLADMSTQVIGVGVDCTTRTFFYEKMILFDPAYLEPGWQGRQQARFTALHCNHQGLASANKWNVSETVYDLYGAEVITLTVSPGDCR
ncbi:hypothetical protein JJJ17_02550 [Paracoccus caeni]|uniref:Uncharacterized protein n=1 Tax=Paracoccus caeni TaxID=657651 RepID=A0A934VYI8_9RHOB|nr:hypothetical protein [Paracoccus caeni]MBK4214800.1 hypothetical protein [Paracoccus caeni]